MVKQKQQNNLVQEKLIPVGLIFLIDVLLTAISFTASYFICAQFFPFIAEHRLVVQLPVIIAISSLIFLSIGIYKGQVNYDRLRQVYSIFNAICLANILTIVFAVVNGQLIMEEELTIPLSIILVHSILSFLALIASRVLYKNLISNLNNKYISTCKVLLIHDIDDANDFKRLNELLLEKRIDVVSSKNFSSEKWEVDGASGFEAAQALVLVTPNNFIESFSSILEHLTGYGLPMFYGKVPNDWKLDEPNDIRLRRLDVQMLFSPQIEETSSLKIDKSILSKATIMVSGAGGKIGDEFIRTLISHDFKGRLILVENSESALNSISDYCKTFKGLDVVSLLGDVKERKFIEGIFERHRPNFVLHAAGNSRSEYLEDNVLNILRENVLATKVVADVAKKFEVERFVYCSSTAAGRPSTTLDVCKRLCEIYLKSLNETGDKSRQFIALRLNNIFDLNETFFNYVQWQIEMGRTIDLSEFPEYKTFSNNNDIAVTLLHGMFENNIPANIMDTSLGVRIKTTTLVELMETISDFSDDLVKKAVNRFEDAFKEADNIQFSNDLHFKFEVPPLRAVEISGHEPSDILVQNTLETISFNIMLNVKEYPEIFNLIKNFGPGHWQESFEAYSKRNTNSGVINLRT